MGWAMKMLESNITDCSFFYKLVQSKLSCISVSSEIIHLLYVKAACRQQKQNCCHTPGKDCRQMNSFWMHASD
jgi:hypothetical protein